MTTVQKAGWAGSVRGGALLAADWRVTGGVLKIARRIWEVGVAGCGGLNCGLPLMAFLQQKANAKC